MAIANLQLIGLVVACCGGICTLIATLLPDWKKNDPSGDVLEAIVRHKGIWISCVSFTTGMWQCDDYDTFFIGLPTSLQISRGMTMCANLLGFIGFLLAVVGLQCSRFVEDNQLVKGRVALISGGTWIASGVCIGIAASVFSHDVVTDYMRFSNLAAADFAVQRNVFGSALFIGWAAMILTVVGGLMIMCGSCGESHPVTKYQRASVRRVASLGRSVSMSFRRGRPEKTTEYV